MVNMTEILGRLHKIRDRNYIKGESECDTLDTVIRILEKTASFTFDFEVQVEDLDRVRNGGEKYENV